MVNYRLISLALTKYWTLNIEEAHRFNSIDEATEQLCKLNRPHLIKIRKVEGVSE